jgi:hypothetical protein
MAQLVFEIHPAGVKYCCRAGGDAECIYLCPSQVSHSSTCSLFVERLELVYGEGGNFRGVLRCDTCIKGEKS